jgi:amino acid adenylation domain-containing protein
MIWNGMAQLMTSINKLRKITPTEQTYRAMHQGFPPCAIQLWIVADTVPPHDELALALATASKVNVGARLIAKGRWWVDSGKSPQVRHISCSERATLSHAVFHESFACTASPPIEVVSWEGQGLIFRCAHALMDAGGLLFFAEETFRALRNEPLSGSSAKISDYEYLRGLAHPDQRIRFAANAGSPLGPPAGESSGFIWETRTISGHISAVGEKIASTLSNMVHENRPDGMYRFMLPVDLRYFDKAVLTTGNFSNPIFFEGIGASSWNEFYCQKLNALARHDEQAISSFDAWLPWIQPAILGKFLGWTHTRQICAERYYFSGIVSHVGPVLLGAFATKEFRPQAVRLMPFDAPASAITLVTVQHDHGLEISASCPTNMGNNDRLGKVLDRICAELEYGTSTESVSHLQSINYEPIVGELKPFSAELTAFELFAIQAQTHPDRIAVTDANCTLTYAELDRLSLLCALQFQSRGIQPGNKIAVLSGKSSDTIIALLGILRLGAVFVPLDPEWPKERIDFVLNDCQPSCIVFDKEHANLVNMPHCICVSELYHTDVKPDSSKLLPLPDSVAYILYTSGSTGHPKGVVVGQRSLLNYLLRAQEIYLANLDIPVFPFFTSLAFDLTLTSIFLPLVTGGQIRVISQQDTLAAIRCILADTAINAVKLTPSHLWLFWSSGVGDSNLRKFIVGGEMLSTKLAREISAQTVGNAEIFNEYGPTEATVGCVVHRYDPKHDLGVYVPIGRPIANTGIVLLDESMRPVPTGKPGELYLSGVCLALGYLSRPEENIRFLRHPFLEGVRMYRTGDRALQTQDGNLEYLGRTDRQVKIRGHRIEIAEIEFAIESSGLCSACAVMAEGTLNGPRLVAFVTWSGIENPDSLQAALANTLPAYMIPSRIVTMLQLPLNINGKVDQNHLPVLSEIAYLQQDTEDEIMKVLHDIAASLPECALTRIPADKSLLELGFDSLQMLLLLSLVERRFLSDSAQSDFFTGLDEFITAPTLINLAKHLRTLGIDDLNKQGVKQ